MSACAAKAPAGLVWVEGGAIRQAKSVFKGQAVAGFYLGRHEVTQQEWTNVMGANPSVEKGDSLPVSMVSWYDCVDYCNRRSAKEGLPAYYTITKVPVGAASANDLDTVRWTVTTHAAATGYRLPTEAEWEYAASGGQLSKNLVYSGGNTVDEVAWYWKNAGDRYLTEAWSWPLLVRNHNRPRLVGRKAPNELGLHDMSGNVREWCWDYHASSGPDDHPGRMWKGGGWIGADFCCEPAFRASLEANGQGPDQGFRVCRNK